MAASPPASHHHQLQLAHRQSRSPASECCWQQSCKAPLPEIRCPDANNNRTAGESSSHSSYGNMRSGHFFRNPVRIFIAIRCHLLLPSRGYHSISVRGNHSNRAAICRLVCGVAQVGTWLGRTAVSKTLWLRTWGGADGPCRVVVDRSACPGRTGPVSIAPAPSLVIAPCPLTGPAKDATFKSPDAARQWEAAIFRSLLRPLLTPSPLVVPGGHAACPMPTQALEFSSSRPGQHAALAEHPHSRVLNPSVRRALREKL